MGRTAGQEQEKRRRMKKSVGRIKHKMCLDRRPLSDMFSATLSSKGGAISGQCQLITLRSRRLNSGVKRVRPGMMGASRVHAPGYGTVVVRLPCRYMCMLAGFCRFLLHSQLICHRPDDRWTSIE